MECMQGAVGSCAGQRYFAGPGCCVQCGSTCGLLLQWSPRAACDLSVVPLDGGQGCSYSWFGRALTFSAFTFSLLPNLCCLHNTPKSDNRAAMNCHQPAHKQHVSRYSFPSTHNSHTKRYSFPINHTNHNSAGTPNEHTGHRSQAQQPISTSSYL